MSLSVLYPPKGAEISVVIDIVAVHGLGGDATNSWTHPKSKAFWLKDFLPLRIPDARIMTFGYDADVAFGRSCAEIIDHAKGLLASLVDKREEPEEIRRPLIFIAHSLGGIVVKQALLQARLEPLYRSVQEATHGLMFLGTPHRGMDLTTYKKVLATVAQVVTHRPPAKLLTALQANSDTLLRLTTDFRFQLPDYKVYSFYEQQAMTDFSRPIVEKHSALLEVSHEEQIPVNADHKAMIRCWGVFWVDASSAGDIQWFFTRVARTLEVDETVDSVKRRPTNTTREWLLVFDNADDLQINLGPYLPAGNRGNILITSRNPHCSSYNTAGCQEIGKLSPEESFLLLAKNIHGSGNTLRDDDLVAGREIVNVLGLLALAIVQAGSYIREVNCSLFNYLEIYKRRKKTVLEYLSNHTGTDYRYSLYTTWQVSIEAIESRQDRASNQAIDLLDLLGFYHHDQIPVQMFYNVWNQAPPEEVPNFSPWPNETSDLFDYQQAVQKSISLLVSFSLITRKANDVSLHPLVHAWCRDRMGDQKKRITYQRALTLLGRSVRWEFESDDFEFRRSLVDHVFKLLEHGGETDNLNKTMKLQLWRVLALILVESGQFRDAVRLLEEEVELSREILASNHPNTFVSIGRLAEAYWSVGEHHKSVQLLEESLPLQNEELGDNDYIVVSSMGVLAKSYAAAGRPDEAVQLQEKVVRCGRDNLGDDDPATLGWRSNLASMYGGLGRQDEALILRKNLAQSFRDKLGNDHPQTLQLLHNLVDSYLTAGQLDKALPLAEEVVHSRRRKLGDDHVSTLESIHGLALSHVKTGKMDKALPLAEEVLRIRREKLGVSHADTLNLIQLLVHVYNKTGQLDKALPVSEELLQSYRERLGDSHPDTLESIYNLAVVYKSAQQLDKALLLAEELVASRGKLLGIDHPDTQFAVGFFVWLSRKAAEDSSIAAEASSIPAESRSISVEEPLAPAESPPIPVEKPSVPGEMSLTPAEAPSTTAAASSTPGEISPAPETSHGSGSSRRKFRD